MVFSISDIPLPVRIRTAAPMSDEELLRFCEANDSLGVERRADGEILVMTPANFKTSNMNSRLVRLLDEWAEVDGRGYATDSNGGFSLPDGSMRAPDAAWVLKTRVDALTEKQRNQFPPLCPEFVIELLSPSDSLRELRDKMENWIANGTQLAWLIDPAKRVVTVYRPGQAAEELNEPSSLQGTGVMAGFELVMERVWG